MSNKVIQQIIRSFFLLIVLLFLFISASNITVADGGGSGGGDGDGDGDGDSGVIYECSNSETQSQNCGNCGTQIRYCVWIGNFGYGSYWGEWGLCTGEGVCSSGSTESQLCGLGGTQSRTCASSCSWGSWGSCTGEGVCSPGATQSQSCGLGGTQSRTCQSNYQWGSWGSCTGEGECQSGDTQSQSCGLGGTQTRTCVNWYWTAWGDCTGEGSCSPGDTQSQDCGLGGTQTRACQSNYQWGDWSTCIGEGECSSGDTQTQSCGLGGTQTRTCVNWYWSSWGTCSGEGICYPGTTTSQSCGTDVGVCVSGTQSKTCLSNYYWGIWGSCGGTYVGPSTEVCDGLDNDCDGSTDEEGVCNPVVSITSPTQGAIFIGVRYITWTATDPNQNDATLDIKIEYRYDGISWTVLEDGTDNNDGTFTWDTRTVPNANDYQLRVTARDDQSGTGADTVTQFTIGPNSPVVSITSPQVGDIWYNTRNILWTATDTAQAASTLDILIEYRNDGINWVTLENGADNNDGTFSWNTLSVPDDNDYELRVTATNDVNGQGTDYISQFTIRNGPTIVGIPDQTFAEDSGLNNNIIDLWNYTSDPNDADSDLTFTIISETNTNVVDCSVDSNRYIDCTTQQDQHGYSDITVQAADPSSRTGTDTFRVTITSVNDAPTVIITHPDTSHNNFVEDYNVRIIANASDVDNDPLTYIINYGDGQSSSGNVVNNMVNLNYTYSTPGTYTINLTVSDGSLTATDTIGIVIWPHAFNITELTPYNNSGFSNEDYSFYRNEALYVKFNVIDKNTGTGGITYVPNNINYVYMYNRDEPSQVVDLSAYNNGNTIINGQPAAPNGTYYYYLQNIPLGDEYLGWNIVFVFSHNNSHAGQHELEIEILNNPIQLSNIPDVVFGTVNYDNSIDLDDYVYDLETPDNEITWSYSGSNQVTVSVASDHKVAFSAPTGWIGIETLTFTADDNDGSTASDNVVVSAGPPSVTLLNPQCGAIIYQSTNITWNAVDYQGDPITIDIEYSSNNGTIWMTIATNEANDGIYLWDVSNLAQGSQYLVRVTASDGTYSSYDVSSCPFTILDTPPSSVTVNIIAEPSSGVVPLTVIFRAELTGNAPFSYTWDLDGDGDIDSTDPEPTAIYNEVGGYEVSLTVTDFDGDVGTDTQLIRVREPETKEPRNWLSMDKISFISGEFLKPGDDLVALIAITNIGNYDLNDLKITGVVDDIDMRRRIGPFDLDAGYQMSKKLILGVPYDAMPGEYNLRITISNENGFRRVRHRPFFVV